MQIRFAFAELKNYGISAYARIRNSFTARRLKKEETLRQIQLMSGSIKRVK